MEIAIVGSGAAAYGALLGLPRRERTRVTLVGPRQSSAPAPLARGRAWTHDELAALYRELRAAVGLKLPAPKSHLGVLPGHYDVGGRPALWRSDAFGGLTTWWGGNVAPFTARELRRWPIGAQDLAEHYRLVADDVGVAGERDALEGYFGDSFVTRPPVRALPLVEELLRALPGASLAAGARVLGGSARLAVETRPGHEHRCRYTGQCMVGCPFDAVWSARRAIAAELPRRGARHVEGTAVRFHPARRTLVVSLDQGGLEEIGPFDRVLLAGGAIGTAALAMRSLSVTRGLSLADNSVWTFPLVRTRAAAAASDEHLALTNGLLLSLPDDDGAAYPVQLYPALDHMWRALAPSSWWPWLEGLGRALRGRALIGRFYLPDHRSPRYALSLHEGRLALDVERAAERPSAAAEPFSSLRRTLARAGFYVPEVAPLAHATSSHYAATLPPGSAAVGVSTTGELEEARGVFVADSSWFPDSPALSPTLTILALAARAARCASEG